jgi:hypothetical protein
MYRDAADRINANGGYNGTMIQPHQLQAATWLTRQRLNTEGGYSSTDPNVANRTRKVSEASVRSWNDYAAQHHPDLVGRVPGTGFSTQQPQPQAPIQPQTDPYVGPSNTNLNLGLRIRFLILVYASYAKEDHIPRVQGAISYEVEGRLGGRFR